MVTGYDISILTVCEHEVILVKRTQIHIEIDRYDGINFQFCQRLEEVCFIRLGNMLVC